MWLRDFIIRKLTNPECMTESYIVRGEISPEVMLSVVAAKDGSILYLYNNSTAELVPWCDEDS